MKKKIIAIILARGGSKGIPRKNILPFLGIPLLGWSIIQSKSSKLIDEVYLSSDSEEILEIGEKYGAKKIIRPAEFATDEARSEEAVKHALSMIKDDVEIVIMLEPTAPLRKTDDLDNCVEMFRKNNFDSCFSGAVLQDFLIWKKDNNGKLVGVNHDYLKQGPRQMRDLEFVENGAIFMFKPNIMLQLDNRFGGQIGIFPNEFWQSFEIDEPDDWEFVEMIFKKYLYNSYKDLLVNF
ncbi:acylneuraminate cytidylyltransferase family protein [Alphaproteobacteria bacterium]|nr:acylneuraminate cytidylyltransferase family protein [Alphaproteobacteria bacterium]